MEDGAPLGGKGYGVEIKRDKKRTSPWGIVLLWEVKDMGLRLRGMKRELRRGGWCSFGR